MNPIEYIDKFILEVVSLKGATLMVVFLIVLGYGLKSVPRFPNDYIPHVVIVFGTLLAPFFVGWPQPGQMPHEIRYPMVTAWIQILLTGFLLGNLAWLLHRRVLKRWIDDRLNAEKRTKTIKELKVEANGVKRTEMVVTNEETKPKPETKP